MKILKLFIFIFLFITSNQIQAQVKPLHKGRLIKQDSLFLEIVPVKKTDKIEFYFYNDQMQAYDLVNSKYTIDFYFSKDALLSPLLFPSSSEKNKLVTSLENWEEFSKANLNLIKNDKKITFQFNNPNYKSKEDKSSTVSPGRSGDGHNHQH